MKKFAILFVVGLFLVSGCGKKNQVTCTAAQEEEGQKYTMTLTADIKDDKVSGVSAKMDFDNEDTAKSFCGILGLVNSMAEDENSKVNYDCGKKSITIKNYENLAESEGEEVTNISKEEFIKELEEEGFTCK